MTSEKVVALAAAMLDRIFSFFCFVYIVLLCHFGNSLFNFEGNANLSIVIHQVLVPLPHNFLGLTTRIVAFRLLYSCNTTCAVVFWDCQANARRLTELVQYTTDTLATTTGSQKGWRQRVERHTQSQLSCWSTGITNLNELQVWWTSKNNNATTDQVCSFPRVPRHQRSQPLYVPLIKNHVSGTEVLAKRLIGTCAQM